jgi:hypothetical protein
MKMTVFWDAVQSGRSLPTDFMLSQLSLKKKQYIYDVCVYSFQALSSTPILVTFGMKIMSIDATPTSYCLISYSQQKLCGRADYEVGATLRHLHDV